MSRPLIIREFAALEKVFEISVLSFVMVIALGIFDFVLPLYAGSLVASVSILSLALVADNVVSLFLDVPIGLIVDKYGRKIVILSSMLLLGAVVFAYAFAMNIWQIMVLELIFGAVSIAFWIPSAVIVRDYSPPKLLGESQGVYLSVSRFGRILAPVIAGIVAVLISLRFNFILFTGLAVLGFLYGIFILRTRGRVKKTSRAVTKGIQGWKSFVDFYNLHDHSMPLFFLSFFAYTWIGIEWVFTQLTAQQVFRFDVQTIGFIFGGMILAEVLLYFPSGYLMDKIGKKYIIISGFLLLFASSYFLFLTTVTSHYIFFLFMSAGAVGWILPGTEALLTEIVSEEKRGEMTGVFDMSRNLGLIAGPLLAGGLVDLTFNLMSPFILVAMVAAIGVGFSLRLWT